MTFVVHRLGQMLIVLLVISCFGFAIQTSLGDPLRELVGQAASESEREALREKLGLNDPLLVQYGRFLRGAVQGDLGTSYFHKKPALTVILSKFPATFELVIAATFIIVLVSLPAGIYCAVHPRTFLSRLVMAASIVGMSVPVFLTGVFLIYVFAVQLGGLPSFGRGETVMIGPWESGLVTLSGLEHLILPAITLSSIMLPLFIRLVRGALLEELGQDYVRTAFAKGLPRRRIWLQHALRNASLPIVTIGGLQAGTMIAYTILTETVFQWPGMGFMFLEAVTRADTPLIIAYVMVVGVMFVLINTVVDLLYMVIDPRVSLSGERS